MSITDAIVKMRGKKGVDVRLGIWREGFEKPRDFVLKRADEALPTSASSDGDTVVGASAENVSAVEYATLRKHDESVVSPRSATISAPQLIRGGEQLRDQIRAGEASQRRQSLRTTHACSNG
jgi:hypothetical protein